MILKNSDFALISGSSFFFIWTLHTLVSAISNRFDQILTKLYETVCGHKMEARSDNQLNSTTLFGVMALGFLKIQILY